MPNWESRGDNQYRGIVLLRRGHDATQDELLKWYLGPHSRFGLSAEGIREYTGSLIVGPGPRYEYPEGRPPFDLISETWCRDRAALEGAYAHLESMGGPRDTLAAGFEERIALVAEEFRLK